MIIYINKYVSGRRGEWGGEWFLVGNNMKESRGFKIDLRIIVNYINLEFFNLEFLNFGVFRLIFGIDNILKYLFNLFKRIYYF